MSVAAVMDHATILALLSLVGAGEGGDGGSGRRCAGGGGGRRWNDGEEALAVP